MDKNKYVLTQWVRRKKNEVSLFTGNDTKLSAFIENFKAGLVRHISVYGFGLFDRAEGWFYPTIGKTNKVAAWITSDSENEQTLSPLNSGIDHLIRAGCFPAGKNDHKLLAFLKSMEDTYGIREFLLGRLEAAVFICDHYIDDYGQTMRLYSQKAHGLACPV